MVACRGHKAWIFHNKLKQDTNQKPTISWHRMQSISKQTFTWHFLSPSKPNRHSIGLPISKLSLTLQPSCLLKIYVYNIQHTQIKLEQRYSQDTANHCQHFTHTHTHLQKEKNGQSSYHFKLFVCLLLVTSHTFIGQSTIGHKNISFPKKNNI